MPKYKYQKCKCEGKGINVTMSLYQEQIKHYRKEGYSITPLSGGNQK